MLLLQAGGGEGKPTCDELRVLAGEAEGHEAAGLMAREVDAGGVGLRGGRVDA